jgi:hypothetical protein
MKKNKPITPEEASHLSEMEIPEFVFEAFNKAIIEKYDGNKASVLQNRVIELIIYFSEGIATRELIFSEGLLNIEDIYRKNGWSVEYDKPGFDETYEARFIFKKK